MKNDIKASRGNAQVGIWWYTDDCQVIGVSKPADSAELNGACVQYSCTENHMTLWHKVITDNYKDSAGEIIEKGYKSFERGRVIYDCRTCCYEVTCSEALFRNREFRHKIIEFFDLSGNQVEFVVLGHYHKEELTGNPALDDFYYNSDM